MYYKIKNYYNNNCCNCCYFLETSNNEQFRLKLSKESGTFLKRELFRNFGLIQHTGLIIGRDWYSNEVLILHNHINSKGPSLTSYSAFADGMDVSFVNKNCKNDRIARVFEALNAAVENKPYKLIGYNCIDYTNDACNSEKTNSGLLIGAGFVAIGILGVSLAK